MRVARQPRPVVRVEPGRIRGERRRGIDGPVAGEHAAAQEAVARVVGGELEVAVEVAVANPLLEALADIGRVAERDDALHLDARAQPQLHARDHAEEAIPANRQPEQLRVLAARAGADGACRVEQVEGLHLIDDRLEAQAPAVRVARQRAAEAQAVGAGLLLDDAPARISRITHGTRITPI